MPKYIRRPSDRREPRGDLRSPEPRPHASGDAVLERLARLARRSLRTSGARVSVHAGAEAEADGDASTVAAPSGDDAVGRLARRAARLGGPLLVDDVRGDPRNAGRDDPALGAYAGVPLRGADGEVLGTLSVFQPRPRAWTPDDVELLSTLAESVVAEIELRREGERRREAEQRLSVAAEAAGLATWDRDLATGTITFDGLWERILGYAAGEITEHRAAWEERVHPEDMPDVLAVLDAHTEGDLPLYQAEYRIRDSAGGWRWILSRGRMVERAPDGTPVRVAGIHKDVTADKLMERALTQSREQIARVLESITDAFVAVDARWCLTYVNAAAAEVARDRFGLDPSRLRGRNLWEVLPDLRDVPEMPRYLQAMRDRSATHFEGYFAPFDAWFSVDLYPASDGGLSIYFRDVTERRATEHRLRQTEAHYRRLVATSPVGIFALDPEGRIVEANDALGRILGHPAAALVGEPFSRFLVSDGRGAAGAPFRCRMKGEEVPQGTLHCVRLPSGEVRQVRAHTSLMEEDGRVLGIHGVVRDVTEDLRRDAEQRRLGAVLEASWHEVYIFDADSLRILQVSRGARENLGYSQDELRALTPQDVLREMDPEAFAEIVGSLRRGERERAVFETTHRRRDGTSYPVEARLQLSRDAGEPVFVAVVLDLTERRAAEEALAERERYYRSLIENSTDAVSLLSAEGTVGFVSPAGRRVYGWGPEVLVGENAFARVHPDDRAEARAAFAAALEDPEFRPRISYRMRQPDGSWRHLEATGINLLGDPAVRGVVIHSRDITERHEAEELIRFKGTLLDAVGQAVVATDREGRIRYWNAFAETLYGWSRDEVMGRPAGDLMLPSRSRGETDAVRAALAAHGSWSGEFPVRRADGTEFPAHVTCTPIRGEDGSPEGVVGVSSDLTDRKRLEEQFHQAQKMEAVGRLAGGVAHDFNNLLTVIKGHIHMLRADLPSDAPGRADAQVVAETVERAAALTQQLLAFSRKQVVRPRVVDANEIVGGMERMLRRLIGEDIELRLDSAPGPCPALVDAGQLEQVVMNLVVNARDAMPAGGRLELRTRRGPAPGAVAGLAEPGAEHVCIEVRDTGEGMDAETLSRVFEPFFTTKEVGRGTGLGLSTVYGIVRQAGGAVVAESEPGRGSTFRVYLPRREALVAAPAAPAPEAPGGSETVLVVEDDAALRGMTRSVLLRKGYTVLEARRGDEALVLSDMFQGPIDLLVTDVVMPGLSGRELAEALASRRPGCRALFMSGYTDDAVLRHGIAQGRRFLPKPFSPDQLLRQVRAALDGGAEPTAR